MPATSVAANKATSAGAAMRSLHLSLCPDEEARPGQGPAHQRTHPQNGAKHHVEISRSEGNVRQCHPVGVAADALRALESGNGRLEPGQRRGAAETGEAGHRQTMVQGQRRWHEVVHGQGG